MSDSEEEELYFSSNFPIRQDSSLRLIAIEATSGAVTLHVILLLFTIKDSKVGVYISS